ncbi:hypothetical protein ACKVMT_14040 [Halobacteriales archaeon Cl-PHB]
MVSTTTAAVTGLAGGLLATIVMSAFMMGVGDDSPPPTALFWSQYLGDGPPSDYLPQGMALHTLYGIGAGAVFTVGAATANIDVVGNLGTGLAAGVGWGFVLFVGAAGFWMTVVLDVDPEPGDVAQFLLFHLVYGAVLGALAGVGLLA